MSHTASDSPASRVFLLTHTKDAILCYLQPSDIRTLRLVSRLFLKACFSTPTRWLFKKIVHISGMPGELWDPSTTAYHVNSFRTNLNNSESLRYNLDMVDSAIAECPNLSELVYDGVDARKREDRRLDAAGDEREAAKGNNTRAVPERIASQV
ncbi:hypothetical protein BGX26_005104, partial [Mortierella sp. AD094]